MPDVNLHSFHDIDSGRLEKADALGHFASKPDWDDTLKISSQCRDFMLFSRIIWGGREDCVDINNRAQNIVVGADFFPQGKYACTIKGGAHSVKIIGRVSVDAKEVDIDLGNWSDQSQEKTRGVCLQLSKTAGPVTVRVLHADKPALLGNGPYRYVFPHPDA